MENKFKTFGLLSIFGAMLLQVQPPLSLAANSNIAVAAAGANENSEISEVAGRAPYYLIFDQNGVFLKSIENSGQRSMRGSSSAVVDLLLKESCNAVIAGQFGEKMQSRLKANRIESYQRTGIVKDVLKTFGSGK
ncbi:MAG: NifB/NifX family molybdenum-iron cluster-binding protein [Desulfobacterales bacterium]|jgi:predicted Fe-Mo cluster-binding NifX family protein|nr:NifB/NifX family molybdenum-iron cluster-binding protein [Desulfobacteraceae bacterium]MDY0312149.1 NifB/NifX family molybdenum-iron cluster-binding protein [Desulfobacterales bacterium]